jgi:hypothetical protein
MKLLRHNCETKGHKYEARYDYMMPLLGQAELEVLYEMYDIAQVNNPKSTIREQIYNRAYVHDICVYCGNTVGRSGQATSVDVVREKDD